LFDSVAFLSIFFDALCFIRGICKQRINYDELVEDLAKLTKVMGISADIITEIIKSA